MNKSVIPIVMLLAVLIGIGVLVNNRKASLQSGQPAALPTAVPANPTSVPEGGSDAGMTGGTAVTEISLTVSAPADQSTVTSPGITVRGKTVAGADVFVNDAETKADSSGNFSVSLTLEEGDNYILVVANDANGNFSEKELTVYYSPQ